MSSLRLALRLALRQPLVSALAVVALALGIGLTTMMFSILNGAVLRGLPFEQSDRILLVAPSTWPRPTTTLTRLGRCRTTSEWRARQKSYEDLAGLYSRHRERGRARWHPRTLPAAPGSHPNIFGSFARAPVSGRDFREA